MQTALNLHILQATTAAWVALDQAVSMQRLLNQGNTDGNGPLFPRCASNVYFQMYASQSTVIKLSHTIKFNYTKIKCLSHSFISNYHLYMLHAMWLKGGRLTCGQ